MARVRQPSLKAQLSAALSLEGPLTSDFDLNDGLRPQQDLRPAAVLVGVIDRPRDPHVILTRRSAALRHHPGQIAFPGGKVDATDASVTDAALREAHEEIGLARHLPEVIGVLPGHCTVTSFSVTPVVAVVPDGQTWVCEVGEVAETFEVPLSHFADPSRFRVEGRMWQGQFRRYYIVPWGPYYIWGATARMLKGLAERLTP